jgi:DNA polymerase III subunit alpha
VADRSRSLEETSTRIPVRKKDDCNHDESPLVLRKQKRTRRLPQRTREMRFASLHHHSTFSYLDGFQLPEAHVRRATEIGMGTLAMTEHGNVSSHVQLEDAAKKQGVKPIFGVELYSGAVGEQATQRKNHLTVLAATPAGYRNLLQLVSRTFSEGFYYEPTADGKMLAAHKEGLIVLSGCQSGELFTALVGGKHVAEGEASYERAKRVALRYKRAFGDAYYIEVQAFPGLDKTRAANPLLAQLSGELRIPLVATFDCHYTVPEEKEIQQVLHTIRPGNKQTLEDQVRDWGYAENLCPPWTDTMVLRKLEATGLTRQQAEAALLHTEEIVQRTSFHELPSLPMVRYPLPRGYESGVDLWRDWIQKGWMYRGCDSLPPKERRRYKERVQHEVKIIEDKDFVDYFLIVSDAVRWAKDHDVAVGPARGSAAGSLVCWLLRITEVNPLLYPDLVFERFIDVTREDLPDIDLDFDSERRGEVRDYLVSKYGRDCVNNVGTFTQFKSKNSLDDAGKVFKVPKWEVERVKDVLIERSSGDLRASATIEDTVEQFPAAREVFEKYPDLAVAMDLEGNYKGFGVHAAGLVVSTGPIDEVAAVYEREVKGERVNVISMDKYDAEKKGLLKLDFLGLSNVTAINKMRLEMDMSLDDVYNLPLDDPETLAGFKRNDVTGIFQFEGRAMRYVNGALQPDDFKELADVNALSRPGPLHNGAANEYIDIKMGRKQPELVHPALAAITGHTKYQIVYQEQILRILGEIGNFDWTHRAEVRRIISRKIGEQAFNRRWEQFRDGARLLHKMDDEISKDIWGKCITAGAYAFNASHAVAYTMLGFEAMWFKQHIPELFFQEMLKISNEERARALLRDTQRHGRAIDIKPPHPKRSDITWTRRNGSLQAGFDEIPDVGPALAKAIIAHREEQGLDGWEDLLAVKGIGDKTFAKMRDFAAQDDPFKATWLDRAVAAVKGEILSGQLDLPAPTHVATDLPYSTGDDIEIVWLGVIHTRNVRDLFEFNQAKGKELTQDEDGNWYLDGKIIKDPHLNEWCVMVGDDETDQIGLRCDRYKYPKWRDLIWRMRPGKDLVLVRGVKPGWMPTRQITISEMWVIDPEL